eukprot:COSAG05_NODE_20545_length_278_cov_1.061453_1_plen_36_part_10
MGRFCERGGTDLAAGAVFAVGPVLALPPGAAPGRLP